MESKRVVGGFNVIEFSSIFTPRITKYAYGLKLKHNTHFLFSDSIIYYLKKPFDLYRCSYIYG